MGQPVTISWDGNYFDVSMPARQPDFGLIFVGATDAQDEKLEHPAGGGGQYDFREGNFSVQRGGAWYLDVSPTKVTFAVVPNVHTTFYVQPRLVTSQ